MSFALHGSSWKMFWQNCKTAMNEKLLESNRQKAAISVLVDLVTWALDCVVLCVRTDGRRKGERILLRPLEHWMAGRRGRGGSLPEQKLLTIRTVALLCAICHHHSSSSSHPSSDGGGNNNQFRIRPIVDRNEKCSYPCLHPIPSHPPKPIRRYTLDLFIRDPFGTVHIHLSFDSGLPRTRTTDPQRQKILSSSTSTIDYIIIYALRSRLRLARAVE